MSRIALIENLRVEIAAGAQSHAVPADDTGGLDLAAWKAGQYGISVAMFYLSPSVGGSAVIAAGAHIVGLLEGVLYRIADVNKGNGLTLTVTLGFAQRLQDVGDFEKLWLVDAGDANTHKYGVVPFEDR